MRILTARRFGLFVVALTLLLAWSAQGALMAMDGHCVATMSAMASSNGSDAGEAPPCDGIAPRCVNSFGCVVFVGLPVNVTAAPTAPLDSDRYGTRHQVAITLTIVPEQSPPILAG